MVIFRNDKHVFWQAFIFAVIIFGIGIYIGYWLENSRVSKISDFYLNSELELLDVKISNSILLGSMVDKNSCAIAVDENIKFADRIYEEAKILDRYEGASRISDKNIRLEHKKYDLLRTQFWVNLLEIKKQCNSSYHTVVYFYQYNNADVDKKNKQAVFSNLLKDLKESKGRDIMLIPISGDNNVSSVNFLMKKYNVSILPTVLIDEKIKVTELETAQELENIIYSSRVN